jgi:2,4-dienoyl-CoA reductase-like NADH-dependent reductase (Old Yellow Enzyme family)
VHDDTFIPGLKRLAAAIKEKGAKAVLQIYHGGGCAQRNSCLTAMS